MTAENGERSAPAFRRTDRTDAPYYLARYAERRGLKSSAQPSSPGEADADVPLYLRRFRERGQADAAAALLEGKTVDAAVCRQPGGVNQAGPKRTPNSN